MHDGVRITVNVAQSLNGIISGESGRRVNISDAEDLKRVHRLRAESDAIVVGANTILNDNPDLRVNQRYFESTRSPVRVILDRRLRVPAGSKVLDGSVETIVFAANGKVDLTGAEVIVKDDTQLSVMQIVSQLSLRGIKSILVEGGACTIQQFVSAGIVDEFYVYVGDLVLPDTGVRLFNPSVEIRDLILERTNLGKGVLVKLNPSILRVI